MFVQAAVCSKREPLLWNGEPFQLWSGECWVWLVPAYRNIACCDHPVIFMSPATNMSALFHDAMVCNDVYILRQCTCFVWTLIKRLIKTVLFWQCGCVENVHWMMTPPRCCSQVTETDCWNDDFCRYFTDLKQDTVLKNWRIASSLSAYYQNYSFVICIYTDIYIFIFIWNIYESMYRHSCPATEVCNASERSDDSAGGASVDIVTQGCALEMHALCWINKSCTWASSTLSQPTTAVAAVYMYFLTIVSYITVQAW